MEVNGQSEVVATKTPAAAATPDPNIGEEVKSIINADGTFNEGWRSVLPPELKEDKTLMQFKDFSSLAKTVVHQQRLVGLDKKKLVEIPDDKAPDSVKEAFYKAAGRPEKSTDYKFEKSPELPPEIWDDKLIESTLDELHKAGASQKVIDIIAKVENQRTIAGLKAQSELQETEFKTSTEALKTKWGNNYDANVHKGNIAIEQGVKGNAEFKARILKKFGNDPDFIEYSSNLGGHFGEHNNVKPGAPTVVSTDEIQTKINELMASEAYNKATHPNHNAVLKQVTDLFQRKHTK